MNTYGDEKYASCRLRDIVHVGVERACKKNTFFTALCTTGQPLCSLLSISLSVSYSCIESQARIWFPYTPFVKILNFTVASTVWPTYRTWTTTVSFSYHEVLTTRRENWRRVPDNKMVAKTVQVRLER